MGQFKTQEMWIGDIYYDIVSYDVQDNSKPNATINPYCMVSTVTDNKEFYARANIEGSYRVRRYQVISVWTEMSAFNTYWIFGRK